MKTPQDLRGRRGTKAIKKNKIMDCQQGSRCSLVWCSKVWSGCSSL